MLLQKPKKRKKGYQRTDSNDAIRFQGRGRYTSSVELPKIKTDQGAFDWFSRFQSFRRGKYTYDSGARTFNTEEELGTWKSSLKRDFDLQKQAASLAASTTEVVNDSEKISGVSSSSDATFNTVTPVNFGLEAAYNTQGPFCATQLLCEFEANPELQNNLWFPSVDNCELKTAPDMADCSSDMDMEDLFKIIPDFNDTYGPVLEHTCAVI